MAVRGGAWRCVAVRGGRRTTLIEHENRYGQVSFLPFFRVFFFAAGFRFLDGLAAAGPEAPLSLLADAAEATAGPAPDALASLCREDVDGVKVTGTWGFLHSSNCAGKQLGNAWPSPLHRGDGTVDAEHDGIRARARDGCCLRMRTLRELC